MDLQSQLVREEDVILHAYEDSKKFLTIGCGRLIDVRKGGGISYEEAMYLLSNDMKKHTKAVLDRLEWASMIGPVRLGSLVNMHFQMGDSLFAFHKTLAFMRNNRWDEAAVEMLNSDWAREDSPARAIRVSEQIRTNKWV